jgi:dihydroneopterin triphosphate diphosphatase
VSEELGPVVRECVEAFVYRGPPLEILVLRRPPARGRIWAVVSGKVEATDRDWEAALRREMQEETGLPILRMEPLDWHVPFRADNGEVWRLHGYAVRVAPGVDPRISDEHEAFAWVSVEEALRRLHFPDNREAVVRLAERVDPSLRNP